MYRNLAQNHETNFTKQTLPKKAIATKSDFADKNACLPKLCLKPRSQFYKPEMTKNETCRKKRSANFRERKTWKKATANKTDFSKPETLLETRNLIFEIRCQFEKQADENRKRILCEVLANGLRYLRWGGDGEAVRLEKC